MAVKIIGSRKSHKTMIIVTVAFLVIVILGGGAAYYGVKKMEAGYTKQINNYKMKEYQNKRVVLIPKADIKSNALLEKSMFDSKEISSSISPEQYMDENDFGKISPISLKAGVPVLKYMLLTEQISHDIREEEFNMFFLQGNLQKDDFIDIRICFPNGEDYIVVSKKKVIEIDKKQNTIWAWLSEKEIITASSAIVDAYLNKGTKLYVVKYIEPAVQKQAKPTYPVNQHVISVIAGDPNIVDKAGIELAAQVRKALDGRLKALSPESLSSVGAGVSQDLNSRKESAAQQNQQPASQLPQQSSQPQQSIQATPKPNNSPAQSANKKDNKGSDVNEFFN